MKNKIIIALIIIIVTVSAGCYAYIIKSSISKNPQEDFKKNLDNVPAVKRAEKSLNIVEKNIASNPPDSRALRQAADLYYLKMDFSKAIEYYLKESVFNQEDPTLYKSLADSYKENGQIEEAVVAYKKSLEFSTKNNPACFKLADIYTYKLNQPEEVIKIYETAMVNNPQDLNIKLMLASSYETNKIASKAAQLYEEVYLADPTSIVAKEGLKRTSYVK
jgi:tetratricopeptide (TPR) repeat protein